MAPLYTNTFPTITTTGNGTIGGDLSVTGNLSVLGYSTGQATPAAHNLVAWAYDPTLSTNSTTLTNGVVYLTKMHISRSANITKLYWHQATAGVSPTAGQNFGALYASDGTLMVSASADSLVTQAANLATLTLGSTAVTAGTFVWAAVLFNAGTAPTLARVSGQGGIGTADNVGLTASTYRYATNGTGQTALPNPLVPASNVVTVFGGPWMAIGT